ncbi:MAG: class I SAM-dependent methyltransferase [Synechococcaceae cyanobacterium]|nr:class I SAM-dependent methyltransferase [Synechococcaceae cyanobacterium]
MHLPYFDHLLAAFSAGEGPLETAFGEHVHWGYWPHPEAATGSPADLATAAEALTALVVEAAAPRDGERVLDVGCGFGGTIGHLNRGLREAELVGLNLDGRQLRRARARHAPIRGNRIRFVQGDACRLPFADASFDRLLAVECIFHFPSRRRFLQEARRVLRPGGTLALSDFVLPARRAPGDVLLRRLAAPLVGLVYGPVRLVTAAALVEMAEAGGLRLRLERDITAETLPTYDVLEGLTRRAGPAGRVAGLVNRGIGRAQRRRQLLYEVFAFTAGDAAGG